MQPGTALPSITQKSLPRQKSRLWKDRIELKLKRIKPSQRRVGRFKPRRTFCEHNRTDQQRSFRGRLLQDGLPLLPPGLPFENQKQDR